jgi:hypothetical protein
MAAATDAAAEASPFRPTFNPGSAETGAPIPCCICMEFSPTRFCNIDAPFACECIDMLSRSNVVSLVRILWTLKVLFAAIDFDECRLRCPVSNYLEGSFCPAFGP